MKICIGVPTAGTVKTHTAFTLMKIMRNDYEIIPIFRTGTYLCENQEMIVERAKNFLCSHILFVEADMSFKSDTLPRLLEQDKDIIGGMYNYKFLPKQTMVKFFGKDGKTVIDAEVPKETFKVAGIPLGCTLIKMSVFSKLKKPYFETERDENGKVISSEDIRFCEKARDAGFDVWCDPTIKIKHYGEYEY